MIRSMMAEGDSHAVIRAVPFAPCLVCKYIGDTARITGPCGFGAVHGRIKYTRTTISKLRRRGPMSSDWFWGALAWIALIWLLYALMMWAYVAG
jgi:hypothetical protein